MTSPVTTSTESLILPVLPLREMCLFPEASLSLVVSFPPALHGLDMAGRTGRRVLALAHLQPVGTVAYLTDDAPAVEGGRRIELDGLRRARVLNLVGVDTLVAEVQLLEEGDPGHDWGPAVEALARYLHSHPDLRSFLEEQRRSKEPMSWVNLACQYLPITVSARQKLLEADAKERCLKIGRGLDALLRKKQKEQTT